MNSSATTGKIEFAKLRKKLQAVQNGAGLTEGTHAGPVAAMAYQMVAPHVMEIPYLPAGVQIMAGKAGGMVGKIAETVSVPVREEKQSVKEEAEGLVEAEVAVVEAEVAPKDAGRLSAVNVWGKVSVIFDQVLLRRVDQRLVINAMERFGGRIHHADLGFQKLLQEQLQPIVLVNRLLVAEGQVAVLLAGKLDDAGACAKDKGGARLRGCDVNVRQTVRKNFLIHGAIARPDQNYLVRDSTRELKPANNAEDQRERDAETENATVPMKTEKRANRIAGSISRQHQLSLNHHQLLAINHGQVVRCGKVVVKGNQTDAVPQRHNAKHGLVLRRKGV